MCLALNVAMIQKHVHAHRPIGATAVWGLITTMSMQN